MITIEGFPNYSITKEGVITNLTTGWVKSAWLAEVGYRYVDLAHEGYNKKIALHRLLALHFIPNPENKRTVNHLDGDKLNNKLSNLAWATDSENVAHAYKLGLNPSKRVATEEELTLVYREFVRGKTLTTLTKELPYELSALSVSLSLYVDKHGLRTEFEEAKATQIKSRTIVGGKSRRKLIQLSMIEPQTGEELQTFDCITAAKNFLKVKSCGPISNVLTGRQKTAYGYLWKKLQIS